MEEPNAPEALSAGDNGNWDTEPVTIAAALEQVAEALPDRVDGAPVRITDHPDGSTSVEAVQPTIPGIHPPFDVAAALNMIEEQERVASEAERLYTAAAAKAKACRQEADEANKDLRTLIRDLNGRRHDGRYESRGVDGDTREKGAVVAGEISDPASAETPGTPSAHNEPLKLSSTGAGSEPADSQPDDEMPPATLKELLSKAGADIAVEQIAAWNTDEQTSARVWAEEQRDANAGLNGESVSVAWPAHVSVAHSGDSANRYPKKGKRKKAR